MELSVPINNINTQNVFFVEKKKNIIVDGEFVKILYSTDIFEMNGLYIFVEWQTIKDLAYNQHFTQITNRSAAKRTITINPTSIANITCIERLCRIEHEIIERYIANYCPTKTASYILKTQLLSGTIKYHSDNKFTFEEKSSPINYRTQFSNTASHKVTGISSQAELFKSNNAYTGINSERNISQQSVGLRGFTGYELSPKINALYSAYYSPVLTTEKCILKISGVWETPTTVGITMKFILVGNASYDMNHPRHVLQETRRDTHM